MTVTEVAFWVGGFAFGIPAGMFLERLRMNKLIKESFQYVPGFPRRIAIIHEHQVHDASATNVVPFTDRGKRDAPR